MRILDIFSMALRNMLKRKLRTLLTVMGVVVGSAAITVMISLGIAVNMTFDAMIEEMGQTARRIQIHAWGSGAFDPVIDRELLGRLNNMSEVELAMPIVRISMTFVSGRYSAWLEIMGMEPGAMEILGLNVDEGRTLNHDDEMTIVYSANAQAQFQNAQRNQGGWWGMPQGPPPDIDLLALPLRASFDQNAVTPGQSSLVQPYIVEGAGVMMPSDGSAWTDWMFEWVSFMPMEQVLEIRREQERWQQQQGGGMSGPVVMWTGSGGGGMIMGGSSGNPQDRETFNQAVVVAHNVNDVEALAETIREIGGFEEWSVQTNTWWINQQREQAAVLQNMLAAVGAVAFFIAAIGIANTMIMAIYERTKEIGVMKVIGASVRDVRRLFLLEAAMIGALGGALGLAVSAVASYALNNFDIALFNIQTWQGVENDGLTSYIPMWLFGIAFVFSTIVATASGLLPAQRATRISALAAIRTE